MTFYRRDVRKITCRDPLRSNRRDAIKQPGHDWGSCRQRKHGGIERLPG